MFLLNAAVPWFPSIPYRKSKTTISASWLFWNHADDNRPVNINPILAETDEERHLYERGERNSKQRKEASRVSLIKHTPNDEESDLIHAMWKTELQYHGMCLASTQTLSGFNSSSSRSQRPFETTRQRSPDGEDEDHNGSNYATAVQESPSVHDFWRLSAQANIRVGLHLRSCLHAYAPDLFITRPQHF